MLLAPGITRRLIEQLVQRPVAGASDPRLSSLTEREAQVLTLVGQGLSNAEIAAHLHLSVADSQDARRAPTGQDPRPRPRTGRRPRLRNRARRSRTPALTSCSAPVRGPGLNLQPLDPQIGGSALACARERRQRVTGWLHTAAHHGGRSRSPGRLRPLEGSAQKCRHAWSAASALVGGELAGVGLSGLEPLTSALSGPGTVPARAIFAYARGPRTSSDGAGSRVPLSPTSSPRLVSTLCLQTSFCPVVGPERGIQPVLREREQVLVPTCAGVRLGSDGNDNGQREYRRVGASRYWPDDG